MVIINNHKEIMEKYNFLSQQSKTCIQLLDEINVLSNTFKTSFEKLSEFGENISGFAIDDINEKLYDELLSGVGNVTKLLNNFVQQLNVIQKDANSMIGKVLKNDQLRDLFKKQYSYGYKYNFLQNNIIYSESANLKRTCIVINTSMELDEFFIYDLTYYNTYKYFFNLLKNLCDSFKLMTELPKFGEIFAIKYFGIIYRAVRENAISNSNYISCFLLDYGTEIVLQIDNTSFFELPHNIKHHPSLAIHCKLNMFFSYNSTIPKENFYENALDPSIKYNFKIVGKQDEYWYLDLEEYHNPFSNFLTQAELQDLNITTKIYINAQYDEIFAENSTDVAKIMDSSDNCTIKYVEPINLLADSCQLTNYEKAILHEEPFNTSSALKAVAGYEAEDDMRICKFTEQDECLPNKDKLLSKPSQNKEIIALNEGCFSDILEIGSFIMIIPTAIEDCTTFFAQIRHLDSGYSEPSIGELTRKWNSHEEMATCESYNSTPALFDLVFAKYIDGFFYRAKIIQNRDNNYFVVIYLDYGNIQIVHLSDLKKWDPKFEIIPSQAVHFTFANVRVKPGKAEDLLYYLRKNFLNKMHMVKIINYADSVHVQLYDENGDENLLDKMIDENFFFKNHQAFFGVRKASQKNTI